MLTNHGLLEMLVEIDSTTHDKNPYADAEYAWRMTDGLCVSLRKSLWWDFLSSAKGTTVP